MVSSVQLAQAAVVFLVKSGNAVVDAPSAEISKRVQQIDSERLAVYSEFMRQLHLTRAITSYGPDRLIDHFQKEICHLKNNKMLVVNEHAIQKILRVADVRAQIIMGIATPNQLNDCLPRAALRRKYAAGYQSNQTVACKNLARLCNG